MLKDLLANIESTRVATLNQVYLFPLVFQSVWDLLERPKFAHWDLHVTPWVHLGALVMSHPVALPLASAHHCHLFLLGVLIAAADLLVARLFE